MSMLVFSGSGKKIMCWKTKNHIDVTIFFWVNLSWNDIAKLQEFQWNRSRITLQNQIKSNHAIETLWKSSKWTAITEQNVFQCFNGSLWKMVIHFVLRTMVVHYGKEVYVGSMRKLSTPTKLEYFDFCHYITGIQTQNCSDTKPLFPPLLINTSHWIKAKQQFWLISKHYQSPRWEEESIFFSPL